MLLWALVVAASWQAPQTSLVVVLLEVERQPLEEEPSQEVRRYGYPLRRMTQWAEVEEPSTEVPSMVAGCLRFHLLYGLVMPSWAVLLLAARYHLHLEEPGVSVEQRLRVCSPPLV